MIISWIFLAILIALSAFFSSAETAMTTVNKIKVRTLADNGDKRARTLQKVHEQWPKMLSAILIGNNIVNIAASALATTIAMRININVGVMTMILTLVVLIFGEITPKNAATVYSEKVALNYASVILMLIRLLTPLIWIINIISRFITWLLRLDLENGGESMTEGELRTIVDVSHEDGVIESEEKQMINNVFDFGDSLARDIMIPRIDVAEIDVNALYEDIKEIFIRERYTRLPVYKDDTDNIIGIVNMKDLLLIEDHRSFKIRDIMREAYFTYETKKTSDLMMEMRRESATMAIVLSEYGAAVGIVTMEDLLEEIVGEIRDEYDDDEEELIRLVNDREYIVAGNVKLDDLNDAIGISLQSEDYDSVGGYIIGMLDRLPKAGESVVTDDNIKLEVISVTKNRIERVHIYLPEKREADEDTDEKYEQVT